MEDKEEVQGISTKSKRDGGEDQRRQWWRIKIKYRKFPPSPKETIVEDKVYGVSKQVLKRRWWRKKYGGFPCEPKRDGGGMYK